MTGIQSVKSNNLLKKVIDTQESAIIAALFLLCIVISAINNAFYNFENIMNILRTTSYVVIIAIANTFVFIMAGLDLSVGSVLGLGGLMAAYFMKYYNLPVWLSIILGIIPGVIVGLFNGYSIVKFKIPSMIATLGSLYIARGVIYVLTKGAPVFPLPESFVKIGNGDLFGVPYSVIFMLVLAFIGTYVLKNTTFGRYVYAIGGNEETARLSGINVDKVKIIVYILSGVSAAISGIILTSRVASAQVSLGQGWELNVIASIILGGTSMFGGVGSIMGTIIGALIMSVLQNGMVLMNVSPYWQNIVVGIIIVATVGFDQYRRNSKTT